MDAIIFADTINFADNPENFQPMDKIADRPLLRYILDSIIAQDATRIILFTGRYHTEISAFFGVSYRGVKIFYCPEEITSIREAISKAISLYQLETFYVLDALAYSQVSMTEIERFSQYINTPNVIPVRKITAVKKEKKTVTAGIILTDTLFFANIPEKLFLGGTPVHRNYKALMPCDLEFFNFRKEADRREAEQYFLQNKPKNKAVFLDRDGTINVDTEYLYKKEEMRFISCMPEFIRKWNDWGYYVIVVTNQSGIARGFYTEEDMHNLHEYINKQLSLRKAHIDAFYYCPHHPDFTDKCSCRKPEPGLLLQAMNEFDLEPENCILFGDQERDIEAAKRCGVFAIRTEKNI